MRTQVFPLYNKMTRFCLPLTTVVAYLSGVPLAYLPTTCNHQIVGSNPTKLTTDFTMTRIRMHIVQLLNQNFLICASHTITLNFERLAVDSLAFISPGGISPSSFDGKFFSLHYQLLKMISVTVLKKRTFFNRRYFFTFKADKLMTLKRFES